MPLKVKNSDLFASTRFLGKINTSECSVKFAFRVSTVIDRAQSVFKIVEGLRQKIVEEHHQKDKDGNKMFVDAKKQFVMLTDEGGKRLDELMALESEVDIEQFTIDELEAAGVTATPAETASIKWMIKV